MKKLILLFLFFFTVTAFAEDKIYIQIRFSELTKHGQFSDSLYFTPEDYAKKSKEDITALEKQRVENWIYLIENPAVATEPTKEELEAERETFLQRADELQTKINEKTITPISTIID